MQTFGNGPYIMQTQNVLACNTTLSYQGQIFKVLAWNPMLNI